MIIFSKRWITKNSEYEKSLRVEIASMCQIGMEIVDVSHIIKNTYFYIVNFIFLKLNGVKLQKN